jgi:3-oxoacyl-[acyl-carrier protein] reductase
MTELRNKIVLITGGSRGIGASIAKLFAKQGAMVVINGRDESALESVEDGIRQSGGEIMHVKADLTRYEEIESMKIKIQKKYGNVDILIANAGGNFTPSVPFEDISESEWKATIDGNLTATFLTIKGFLSEMKSKHSGNIITISSGAARRINPNTSAPYGGAKAGIQIVTQYLAKEVGPYGIRVNCIAPAIILTEVNKQFEVNDHRELIMNSYPMGRLGKPEDIANAALFLASNKSLWITGVILDVAGGAVLV